MANMRFTGRERRRRKYFYVHGAAAICSVMLALVDWPAEAAAAQELIARAAAEAAEAAACAIEDSPPDLEAAPHIQAPPSRDGAHVQAHDPCPCCGSFVPATCWTPSLAS